MIPEKVKIFLEKHNLLPIEFDEGTTPTAEMAADKLGVAVGQIAKSILLKSKTGDYHMVVIAGDKKLSPSKLKNLVGSKLSFATREESFEKTGFLPGSVCPFGVDVPIYIDESLSVYEKVYPACGTDGSAVKTSYSELIKILSAKSVCLTT